MVLLLCLKRIELTLRSASSIFGLGFSSWLKVGFLFQKKAIVIRKGYVYGNL